ncbi:MAG: SAM-dependent chlorinase/fluorinase [Ilumatobacteraceae bacterium]|nr:SAM-dependent chlorinase/fluorinase [Ilumatobacteraceae bacterium]
MTTQRYDTISFLSDYGTRDEFVGIVKCVVSDIAPHAKVIDLTHDIPPFDVRAGSLALARCISYVPTGIVLAVVDPGVGTARRSVAVSVGGGRGVLIGPDNGLLSMGTALAGGAEAAVVLNNPEYQLATPGATFAGRDVFAPAAAHLCNGVPLTELGEVIDPNLLLPGVVPLSRKEGDDLVAEITWVDRYGNCQLNVGPDEVANLGTTLGVAFTAANGERVNRSAAIVPNFSAIGGGIGLVIDSFGMLAICVDRGSAAESLSIGVGDAVTLSAHSEPTGATTTVQLRRNPPSPA